MRMPRLVPALGQHITRRLEILDQFQDAAVRELEVRRQDVRIGNTGQHLDFNAAAFGALANCTAQHRAIKLDRSVQVGDGEANVVQYAHSTTSGASGSSRPSTSLTVSWRFTRRARLPLTSTVPGR